MEPDPLESKDSSFFNWKKLILFALLFAGIYLRVEDYLGGHWPYYIHDRNRHVEYIQYVHDFGRLPPPDQGIEFPQQPLYYFLVAHVYNPDSNWRINDAVLAGIGLLISITGLIILACSLKYISSWLVRFVLLSFVLFTPSFILCAPFIGNDGMVQVMGFYTFFCAMRFNRKPQSTSAFFTLALALTLTLFSKLNAVSLILIIPWALWRSFQSANGGQRLSFVGKRAAVLIAVLALWSGVTWYHGQLGRNDAGFKMVTTDKVGLAPLLIPSLDASFFGSFRFFDLLQAAQTTTTSTTPDPVRFSFFTFQYGNMFLGEMAYNKPAQLANATSPVFISGLINFVGALLFFVMTGVGLIRCLLKWFQHHAGLEWVQRHAGLEWVQRHAGSLNLLTVGIMAASTLAIVAYVIKAPYMCNIDFRFQYPALAWIGYGIGRGLATLPRITWAKWVILPWLAAYIISCVFLIDAVFTYAFKS